MKMKRSQKHILIEQFIYWSIWLLIFLAPLIGNIVSQKTSTNDNAVSWQMLGRHWLTIIPFFILFLANNYILLPTLLLRKKYGIYIVMTLFLVIVVCFCNHFPFFRGDNFKQDLRMERNEGNPRSRPDGIGGPMAPPDKMDDAPFNDMEGKGPADDNVGPRIPNDKPNVKPVDKKMDNHSPFNDKMPQRRNHPHFLAEMIFSSMLMFVIAVLMIGFNIAIKLLFQSIRDEEKMKELERERLSSELQYLRYQINPHFFMNTLNNIHALVDIDSNKAKTSIIELSKLMRYVLYEASNQTISLSREIQFINNYIMLMKLRFTDKVHLDVDVPSQVPEVQIPPLLFISFLENAFKHGVSYQKESRISVQIQLNENKTLTFRCLNTNYGKTDEQHHGIGLENIRRRLDLLYDSKYTLTINTDKDKFDVLLIIPLL